MSPSIASIRTSNKSILSALSTPTAVFLGGTSGIGRAMAESFATHTNGAANIIILGRNESAAREIIASFPTSPGAVHEFVKCDATSMKGIGEAAAAIRAKVPRVDFVVLSPGYSAMEGRKETEEGIDRKMAVNYYGRWKFIHDLLPAFAESGTKVLSVLGAGYGAEINVDDLAMKKSYSVAKVAAVTPTYNDLMNESFATLYPKSTFIQSNPGFVRTNYFNSSPTALLRWTGPLVIALSYPFSSSSADCGERMWHGVLNSKTGAVRIGASGQDIGMSRYFGNPEQRKALWEHTVETIGVPPLS